MSAINTFASALLDSNNQVAASSVLESSGIISLTLQALRLNKKDFLHQTTVSSTTSTSPTCQRSIIALDEVANHDTVSDCWIVLYDRVYDISDFLDEHPGGYDVILEYAGRDASQAFRGHPKYALMMLKKFEIGELPEHECIYRREGFLRCDELPV